MLLQRDQFHRQATVPPAVRPQLIRSTDDLDDLIERTNAAQKEYADFSQEQVDKIFRSAALAANAARLSLAKQAVAETGMGVVEDKVIKNHFAAEFIYNKFKHTKTCGVIEWDEVFGIRKIAEPLGILAGIIPTTNPTSTTIFKGLLALKTRNGIIFSPHPRAKACTVEAARILMHAAREAGAPDGIIGWIDEPTVELSRHLMAHPDIDMTLATEEEFLAKLDELSEEAFDDQCTGANPRYPLMSEIRQLLLNAYYGSSAALAAGRTTCEAAA